MASLHKIERDTQNKGKPESKLEGIEYHCCLLLPQPYLKKMKYLHILHLMSRWSNKWKKGAKIYHVFS